MKRIALCRVDISAPRASACPPPAAGRIEYVLPKYFNSVSSDRLALRAADGSCWFCKQRVGAAPLAVETLDGAAIGEFCSRLCRDSFAGLVKHLVALREEPKIELLPLEMYADPDRVRALINETRELDGVYGRCYVERDGRAARMALKSLI
ncbi:late transcription factor VLTF-2 [Bovine papular stomatitis virus]|uniref:Viral late gene transcription factor 2 n=1 Tax=Bovine papular stomatitis virus TaxID=129727 RepID=Q6TVB2_9POXV|nr:late transcription factor VLTF-2 [Bovine papular stomatitis virus]AAR98433.1 ORF076 late transcription factor VLTF-2 [Bovine papular stomatitis virus]AKC03245.1 late transcription factor VLTF-2 [Bovine papular stomatitis virus]AKC03374.1 late transcription factor VLTF-2 [Bovine papular stomatitis virus]AKC03502.1 late transcription factor VLTF-2 [Bovine papular stomatitis virus]